MISPGFIETSGAHGMIMDISRGSEVGRGAARPAHHGDAGRYSRPGRFGLPEEVAELIAFLSSNQRSLYQRCRLRD